jgi:hypothetical protein
MNNRQFNSSESGNAEIGQAGINSTISIQKWIPPRDALERLGERDWKIVELARKDGPRSLNPQGLIAGLMRSIGFTVARPLANDGQEALRRFSVRAWYWDWIRARDVGALYAAGFSTTHAQAILAYVAKVRGFTPSLLEARHSSARTRLPYRFCG